MNKTFWLGFFFFVALVIFLFATLVLSQVSFSRKVPIKFQFDKVEGLRTGDDIRIDGLLAGKVKEITLDKEHGGVNVLGSLFPEHKDLKLYDGYSIYVESFTLLGGNFISIRRGKVGGHEIHMKEVLIGSAQPSALEEVGKVLSENRAAFSEALKTVTDTASEIRGMTKDLRDGKGTVGKLFTDTSIADQISATLKETQGAIKDIRDTVAQTQQMINKVTMGVGTAGKLVNDPALYEDMRSAFGEAKTTFSEAKTTIIDLRADMKAVVADLRETAKVARDMADKVNHGTGLMGKVLNDPKMGEDLQKTLENLRKSSEEIEKTTAKIASGEGTVGKLIQEDGLYTKADKALGDLDRTLGRAARAKVFVGGDYRSYPDSEEGVGRIFLRIETDENKYFQAGVSILGFDPAGTIDYEDKALGESQSFIKPDIFAFYRIPWFGDNHLGVRAGFMEGKPGGGVDFDFDVGDYPVRISFDIRDAYNSVEKENIDEQVAGALTRLYVRAPLWSRGGADWWQRVLHSVKLTAGMSRLNDNPEFFIGLGLEYEDEDIRTLVGLLGVAR